MTLNQGEATIRTAEREDIDDAADILGTDFNDTAPIVGSLLQFGHYDWRILEIKDNAALIISDRVLETHKYHDQCESVTWESCSLRRYLNENFYDNFNSDEKARIIKTRIYNYNNPWFGTHGGMDTFDNIFLLCIDEVTKYFGNSKQIRGKNPNTGYFINDSFNGARKALNLENCFSRWWLRTIGNLPLFAVSVTIDGRIAVSGDFVNRSNSFSAGIRPALWLRL